LYSASVPTEKYSNDWGGIGSGLNIDGKKYCQRVDQRFLGDERFIEKVNQRTGTTRDIEGRQRPVPFSVVLEEIAGE
jgi:hypothetical protein